MTVELRIPEAGESISEVQIGEWRKAEGDTVERDEVLVEIETDKASMELPAPVSGTIEKILKQSGEVVGVGEVIAQIREVDGQLRGTTGESTAARGLNAQKLNKDGGKASRRPSRQSDRAEDNRDTEQEDQPQKKDAIKVATSRSTAPGNDAERPTDKNKRSLPRAAEAPAAKTGTQEREDELVSKDDGERRDTEDLQVEVQPRVMPAARRALAEHGLQAAEVRGTGPGGRVLEEDVLRHVERLETPRTAERVARPGATAAPGLADVSADHRDTVTAMSMLRRRVAERLVEAQHTAAMLTTFNEADMSEVIRLRREYGEGFQTRHRIKLGFMSFFVKAAVEALQAVPQVNGEIRGTDIVHHNYYDIGVAVATEQGLVVPVLRDANQMSFADIEKALEDLARRARDRKISVDELRGGTFTITNGGVFGSLLSTPIINPPQSGILGLHTIQDRPVARDGQVVIRPMMYVALTYDHRLIDGREAVTFLRHIKESIEAPARMLLNT